MDKLKKWAFILAIGSTIMATWSTLITTIYYLETIRRVVELAGEKDQYGKNGLDKYLIMYRQHGVLWNEHAKGFE